jgi:hypothetical protein
MRFVGRLICRCAAIVGCRLAADSAAHRCLLCLLFEELDFSHLPRSSGSGEH